MAAPILPDLDIWMKAFSRHHPDPLVVHAFAGHLTDRRIHLLGWIRQGLLARVADERQSLRLSAALTAFPDLRVLIADHVGAAQLARRLRAEARCAPGPGTRSCGRSPSASAGWCGRSTAAGGRSPLAAVRSWPPEAAAQLSLKAPGALPSGASMHA